MGTYRLNNSRSASAREAFVETQAGQAARAVAAQQPVGHRDALVHVRPAHRHVIVLDQLVLVGRNQQPMAQFDVGALLAFLNPFGVRFEQGKHFLVRGNGFLLQQPAFDQVQVLVEHPVEVFERLPVRQFHGLVAQVEQAGADFGGKFARPRPDSRARRCFTRASLLGPPR